MDPKTLTRLSKKLSWLLRHGAAEARVPMDAAGWAPEEAVLAFLGVSREALRQAVDENTKSRLQWEQGRIRACQGHSTEGTPVTAEALEASWTVFAGEGPLWHGTALEALPAIARDGLLPMARTHVHLAAAEESRVGKRAGVDVLLRVEVAALARAGLRVFESPNGVLLVRSVPPAAISAALPCTKAAERERASLERLFR